MTKDLAPRPVFLYCFKEEGCHITYHRFLPEDYKDLIGE